jgi:hypothetical protein
MIEKAGLFNQIGGFHKLDAGKFFIALKTSVHISINWCSNLNSLIFQTDRLSKYLTFEIFE